MDAAQQYQVVVNSEEQYSIWPAHSPPPPGWRAIGFQATRQGCLDHIQQIWIDMRPLSLRRAMDAAASSDPRRRS
jgi:MbtH protein